MRRRRAASRGIDAHADVQRAGELQEADGLPENRWPTDPDPNLTGLGLTRSGANTPATFDIPLFSVEGIFQDMTLSFAINALGNGFEFANLFYSTDGGGTFTLFSTQKIPEAGTAIISAAVPTIANNAPDLVLRIELTGGQGLLDDRRSYQGGFNRRRYPFSGHRIDEAAGVSDEQSALEEIGAGAAVRLDDTADWWSTEFEFLAPVVGTSQFLKESFKERRHFDV